MYAAAVVPIVVMILSLYVVVATTILFVRIVRGGSRIRFFDRSRGRVWDGGGRVGISLLCRDNGDVERLGGLLAVECPDYEVVVVADSLRNPHSLQLAIERYQMVAVDGRISGEGDAPRVRKMYRSAKRCYRRLILLDVVTTGRRSDLDVAYEVATYDFLLPLWGDERLAPGAVERIVAEISAMDSPEDRVVVVGIEREIEIIPAKIADNCRGVSGVRSGFNGRYRLYEPLVANRVRNGRIGGVLISVLVSIIAACVMLAVMEYEVVLSSVVAFTLLFIVVAAYASSAAMRSSEKESVGYGETLSLFCENLLPRIWKIRK